MSLPDDLTVFAGLIHAPDGSNVKLAALLACHCGTADGEATLKPIKSFGSPVIDALGPMPYGSMNQMLDAGFPKGALNYWKSNFEKAHDEEGEKGEQEIVHVRGVGDDAVWSGNHLVGALYVLRRDTIVRISVGGPGTKTEKIAKARRLGARALARL